jgi:hypothetical protein
MAGGSLRVSARALAGVASNPATNRHLAGNSQGLGRFAELHAGRRVMKPVRGRGRLGSSEGPGPGWTREFGDGVASSGGPGPGRAGPFPSLGS